MKARRLLFPGIMSSGTAKDLKSFQMETFMMVIFIEVKCTVRVAFTPKVVKLNIMGSSETILNGDKVN